jgi:IS1 family transposase
MANNLPNEKKVLAVSMLAEGSSIRSIERITQVHRDTIMRLGVRVGEACARIHNEKMRGLDSRHIEIDEIWGFIGKKRKNTKAWDFQQGLGDAWTFIALDSDTKLIPSFLVGQRTVIYAKAFVDDLASRLRNRIQLSSDALAAYTETVEASFGSKVDYGQIVKTYSVSVLGSAPASVRYSPADVVDVAKKIIAGTPDACLISTSHVEKQNHTLRMHCRRLTRLTNAFSKKLDNFCAAVALNFTYYNFCKRHLTVRCTPAQAAGIESAQWTVAELVERCGE